MFDVRISSAIIDNVESEFSDFSGFTRYILPLEGEITLIKDNQRIVLSHNALYEFEDTNVSVRRIRRVQWTSMSLCAMV